MKEFMFIIGLLLELSGVILMASSNITKIKLEQFPLTRSRKQRRAAYAVAVGALISLVPIGYYLQKLQCWPWLLWLLSIGVAFACLPSLIIYADRYSRGIGEPRDEEKVQKLNIQGLAILAVGFALQSLAAVLSP